MTEQVKKTRSEIVQKFCRTILWIDDDVHLCDGVNSGVDALPTLFKDKLVEFEGNGLLCHLKGFPKVLAGEKSDPYAKAKTAEDAIKSCVALAQQADVVIIDWKLGDADSSQHAQKIISQLLGPDKGFRIIVVLSQDAPADSAFQGLDESFKAMPGDGGRWQNGSGQFLLSLRKDHFKDHNLFDSISEALLAAYPDYLHLTAMEMTGRIKELTPRWFSALPKNVDVGMQIERSALLRSPNTKGHWREDLQECVLSNLVEDLQTIVVSTPLEALHEDVLLPSNTAGEKWEEWISSEDVTVNNRLQYIRDCIKDTPSARLSSSQYKQVSEARKDARAAEIVASIEAYTEFCETVSCDKTLIPKVCPGVVYSGLIGEANDIAVCVSAGCDCARPSSLLFLKGSRLDEKEVGELKVPDYGKLKDCGSKTVLRFDKNVYVFYHEASSIFPKKCEELREPARVVGLFRRDIVNRLVSRYMAHIRRVGVNQPAISRLLRDEVDDEE